MVEITPLAHHTLLLFFVQFGLILFVARGLGGIAARLGIPAVVGELATGIVLGPSLFGALAPALSTLVFPATAAQYHLLQSVAWIGLVMLLVLTGFETDFELIRREAVAASTVASASIGIPFVCGLGAAYLLPASLLVDPTDRLVLALFLATAMSISAIPVIARILLDLELLDQELGQLTIAAALINDTVGWLLLALVAGFARSGRVDVLSLGETTLLLVVFLGVAGTVGRRVVDGFFDWSQTSGGSERTQLSAVMVLALGFGAATHALGLEAVIGAFVAGLLVSRVDAFTDSVRHAFEAVTLSVFAPVFFAIAGLRADLTALFEPVVALVGIGLLAVALLGKFLGAYIGAAAVGRSAWEAIGIGAGLNARGVMEIVVATIGLKLGILTTELYTIIVLIALATSAMAPVILRWAIDHSAIGPGRSSGGPDR